MKLYPVVGFKPGLKGRKTGKFGLEIWRAALKFKKTSWRRYRLRLLCDCYLLIRLMFLVSADKDFDSRYSTNIVVSSSGDCLWVPPGLFLSTCKIDITWFPFDEQNCDMKFGSWTYDSSGIDLQLDRDDGDTSSFIANGEWVLIGLYLYNAGIVT